MVEPKLIGIQIKRFPDETWEGTVIRYAKTSDLVSPCVTMFRDLCEEGCEEYYAALSTLHYHACTDVIVDDETVERNDSFH